MSLPKDIDELSQRLMSLPDLIREKQEQANHKEEIDGLKDTLKDRFLDLVEEAGMEVDDSGKKKYSNKELREAKARQLANADPHYLTMKKRLAELLDTNARLSIEIEHLKNELGVGKAVLFGLSERLHYQSICHAAANRNSKLEIALCQTN